jgi:hypothetical protein
MKAPFWAVGCTIALGMAGVLRADDAGGIQGMGPAVNPLGRASATPGNSLDYYAQQGAIYSAAPGANAAAANQTLPPGATTSANGLRYPAATAVPMSAQAAAPPSWSAVPAVQSSLPNTVAPQNGATPAPFTSAAGAVPVPQQRIDAGNAPMTADPLVGAPSNADRNGNAPVASIAVKPAVKSSPWRPVQTAFRQLADPKAGTSQPVADGEVITPNSTPGFASPKNAGMGPTLHADGVQPATTGEDYSLRPFAKKSRMPGEGAVPGTIIEGGPSGENVGGGCGCGPSGDAALCPNCGGWQPGTCRPNNPEGSCICQRLKCCLSKPYPDCSNGCVDFCHSWIFHEDDCWCTSNHKCCPDGCGPYPYGGCPNDGMSKGNGCGCGNCGPCLPAPDLYFSAEALTLSRNDNLRSQSLVEIGGGSVLGTQDFGFNSDWQTGPRFVLGYSPTPMDAWEFSYFGLQHWVDDKSISSAGGLASLPGDLGTLAEFSNASLINVAYSSEIHDAEVNYSWHYPSCKSLSWIAGFRYFHLDEQLDMTSTVTGIGLGEYDAQTVNNLYGGQLGARLNVCCHQFQWDSTVKAGAFGNSIESSQFAAPVGGMIVRDTRVFDSRWAFVGELSSNVRYFFCKNWCATAGFNVLWVDGVALAPDQLDFTNTPTSGLALNHDGNAIYIGGHVGVGVRF